MHLFSKSCAVRRHAFWLLIQEAICFERFGMDLFEGGDVVIPFQQGRGGATTLDGSCI